MKLKDMKSNGKKLSDEENFVPINEAVESLTKAVSVLQSIKDVNEYNSPEHIEVNIPEGGLDYYKAIKYFEISLVKKALQITRGHQTKAAKLLNLKPTTLNAIIKRNKITF